jgi:signal transduction histidine kinase
MPLRSRFAKPSSISGRGALPALLVGVTVVAAAFAGIGVAISSASLAAAGLVVATTFAGAFAVYLIVSERRRHESAEDELQGQARFLESLVGSMAAVADSSHPDEILARTCTEARKLFGARSAEVVPVEEGEAVEAREIPGGIRVPVGAGEAPIGMLELRRSDPFPRVDLVRATMLADFAARAVENTRLIGEAHEREAERGRLTESLITAEQDERRRLSIFLHDGPLQSMSGIALMHDAALAALEEGRYEEAANVIRTSLDRERDTIRTLRDLSFAIEPIVLRDRGFGAAVDALSEQIEGSYRISVQADVSAGEGLAEKAQVALYQLIREAVNQAVQRHAQQITITVAENGDGFTTEIDDDGTAERRRGGIDELDERVRVLSGRVTVEASPEGGTKVRVVLPPYAGTAS